MITWMKSVNKKISKKAKIQPQCVAKRLLDCLSI